MEQNLSTVIIRTMPISVGVSAHIKVYYQFCSMFMQTHQEMLYLKEIFQNMHSRFADALDHLLNHPAPVDDNETPTSEIPDSQDCPKRSIPSELDEIVTSIFGGSSCGYSCATTEKIKKCTFATKPELAR